MGGEPMIGAMADNGTSPPIALKSKGGKPFGVFGRLTDEASLHTTWRVSSKVATFLEQGERIENMAWRLWHVRDVMTTPSTATASSSRLTLDDDQRSFNALSSKISLRMEDGRKRQLKQLTTPEFRWTDQIDALRHRAVMRTRIRDNRASQKPTVLVKAEQDNCSKGSAETARGSSTGSHTSSSLSQKASQPVKRKTSSPPVCWRLTQQEHVARMQRQRQRLNSVSTSSSSEEQTLQHDTKQMRSTWSLEEIEAAEAELREQGVEMSESLLAMLSDLKSGGITKVTSNGMHGDDDKKRTEHADELGSGSTSSQDVNDRKSDYGSQKDDEVGIVRAEEVVEEDKRDRPQCVNCGATSTPLWRRDANFELQCNACGLYEKLHKTPRPRALKKKRRSDRRALKQSPSLSTSSAMQDQPCSPSSAYKTDEWIGIHAGATCANCGTSTTPLWRKDADGRIICNACGLYFKLHNAHRPVTMRMDAIKRRSRCDDRKRFSSQQITQTPALSSPGGADEVIGEHQTIRINGLPSMSNHLNALATYGGTPQHSATSNTHSSASLHHHVHQHLPRPDQGTSHHAHHDVLFSTLAHPQQEQQFVGFNVNAHQAALMANNLSQMSAERDEEIHIPSALWESQVCPMGAWGENCCQNLPQPTIDVSSALLAAAGPSEDLADQAAVNAAMDALLNHGGAASTSTAHWIADLTASQHESSAGGGIPSQSIFNPSAIVAATDSATASSPLAAAIVGPSYPLKRRKLTRRPGNAAPPGTPQSHEAASVVDTQSPATIATSMPAANDVTTPVGTDWWTFATSPADHRT